MCAFSCLVTGLQDGNTNNSLPLTNNKHLTTTSSTLTLSSPSSPSWTMPWTSRSPVLLLPRVPLRGGLPGGGDRGLAAGQGKPGGPVGGLVVGSCVVGRGPGGPGSCAPEASGTGVANGQRAARACSLCSRPRLDSRRQDISVSQGRGGPAPAAQLELTASRPV